MHQFVLLRLAFITDIEHGNLTTLPIFQGYVENILYGASQKELKEFADDRDNIPLVSEPTCCGTCL